LFALPRWGIKEGMRQRSVRTSTVPLSTSARRQRALLGGLVLLLSAWCAPPAEAGRAYVRITGSGVHVRAAPRLSSTVVCKARKGDVFESIGRRGSWVKVRLFSGKTRYVHRSLARKAAYRPSLPRSGKTRRSILNALAGAEKRAKRAAARRYPIPKATASHRWARNIDKAISYELRLVDEYDLAVFHRYRVQPPVYDALEARKKAAAP